MLKQFEILVLDSDENRGKSISEYFSSMQIPTIYSSKLESIDDRYSAFIVDDNFPKINFSRFLIKCKRDNKIVIIMTKNFSQKYLESLLNYGADDYIRVPFSNNDLYSKFLSIYRNGILKPRTIYRYKDIIMDTTSQIVYLDDDVVDLTNNEYKLLKSLMSHPYQPQSRAELFITIWKNPLYDDNSSIDKLVSRLSEKLNEKGSQSPYIKKFNQKEYMMDPK